MVELILLMIYVCPFLAILALCAFVADEILPRFPRAVEWIEKIMEGR